MSAEDWIPDWYPEEEGEEREVRCKYCGERDLWWDEARGPHNRKRWVLVDGAGNIHECPRRPGPATAEEFECLS